MVSRMGQAVRFSEKDVRSMGRPASGVAGMRLRAGDEVIEVDIAADDADLLVVTENGWGKRTRVSDYPVKGRGTMGVKTAQLVEGKGRLAGARIVREGYQVMLISDGGTVIRMAVDGIKRSGRATQGVIVMRLREGEQVSSLAPVIGSDDDPEPEGAETAIDPAVEVRPTRTCPTEVGSRRPACPPSDRRLGVATATTRAAPRVCPAAGGDQPQDSASADSCLASKISPGARPGSPRR